MHENIYQQVESDNRTLCDKNGENIAHIVSVFGIHAQNEYRRHHDNVDSIPAFGAYAGSMDLVEPLQAKENDQQISCENVMEISTSKLTAYLRSPKQTSPTMKEKENVLIDVAVPGDHNNKVKEIDQLKKCNDQRNDVSIKFVVQTTSLPVIIIFLWSPPPNIDLKNRNSQVTHRFRCPLVT